jgi:cytochrome b
VEAEGAQPARIPVWDAPVRLFHWTLAVLVVFSFTTGKVGGGWLEWHMRAGYAILALIVFRLAWGVVGSQTARFTQFVRGPRAALDYVKATLAKRHPRVVGHNPLGGWMVVVMLLVVLAQAVSGLFTDDEISTQGPLAVKVSNALVSKMHSFHYYNGWVIVAAVALHVTAIAVYFGVLRTNLVGPMIHGKMAADPATPAPRIASSVLAAVILAVAGAAVYWLVFIYPKGGA